MTPNWISVGVAYFSPDDGTRRLVSRVTGASTGQPVGGCLGLADCVITFQGVEGTDECTASEFDAWRGDASARAWSVA